MKFQRQLTEKENYPLSLTENLVVQELENETLLYNLKTDKAFCLNETTARVWQLCDGNRSVSEISQTLGKKMRTTIDEDVVWLALDQLKKNDLLADADNFVIDFQGLSRREMIKKAGLATMVALPTIASLVAPMAASAASNNTNGACTSNCIGAIPCNCPANSITCSPGHLVSANVGVGVCVSAAAGVSAVGTSVNAGANGNVCLIATACLL